MNGAVRRATAGDAPEIASLVQAGFIAHVAPDWEASACESFLGETTSEKFERLIREAWLLAVYQEDEHIVGVISLPRPSLVQLLFVEPACLRRGVAKALWSAARAHLAAVEPATTTVELNSTPYALAAYRALGFYPISQAFRRRGTVVTRMACWLPAYALESAANAA